MEFRKIIFISVMLTQVLFSQEIVFQGGELSGTVNWQGTVRVEGDVIISSGAELNIAPGTKIVFSPQSDRTRSGTDKTRCEIIIRGKLAAQGQPDNKIIFTSSGASPRMADWYGILFMHTSTRSVIDYCIVEYAYNGITLKNSSNVTLSNSEIHYNYYAGIRAEVKANPEISRCIISENGYAGIICELGSAPVLTENLISGNPMGLVALSLSQPNLGVSGAGNSPGKNRFSNNEEFDIYNHSSKNIMAQNNTWESQNSDQIALKIYDKKDNGKFGTIQFEPIFNARSRQNDLNRFMILAQDNPATEPAPVVPGAQTRGAADPGRSVTQTASDSNTGIAAQMDSTMEQILAAPSTIQATPLIAQSSIVSAVNKESDESLTEIEPRIDYSQIFLEPFLDTGRKRVLYKENLNVTATLKNVIEPGVVRIKVIVDPNGAVESADILSGMNQIVDSALLNVVRKYRYDVGTVNGTPVRFSTNEVFRFK